MEEKELKKIFRKGSYYNIEIVGIHYQKKILTLRIVSDKYKPGLKKVTPKPIFEMWDSRENKDFYKDFKLKILIYETEKFIKEFEHYNWLYQAIIALDNNTILKIKKILEDHNFGIYITNDGFDKKLKHINITYNVKKTKVKNKLKRLSLSKMKEIKNTYWYQINYFGSRNLEELLNLLDKKNIFYHCIGVSGNWDARPYYYIHHQKENFIKNLKSIIKN